MSLQLGLWVKEDENNLLNNKLNLFNLFFWELFVLDSCKIYGSLDRRNLAQHMGMARREPQATIPSELHKVMVSDAASCIADGVSAPGTSLRTLPFSPFPAGLLKMLLTGLPI